MNRLNKINRALYVALIIVTLMGLLDGCQAEIHVDPVMPGIEIDSLVHQ